MHSWVTETRKLSEIRQKLALTAQSADAQQDELRALSQSVIAGDAKALQAFLTLLVPHLLRVSRRVLGALHPFVEHVPHDAAYTVVGQLASYRGEGTLLSYSRRVALLTAMNMRRRDQAQKRARLREGTDAEGVLADDPDPEQRAASASLAPLLRQMLDTLPEPLAEAFGLNVMLGYTVQEIAAISSAPVETVRSRLRLAKQRLRSRALEHPVLRDLVGPGHE